MSKDWIGKGFRATIGATSEYHERQVDDYYATDPVAIDYLIDEGGAFINGKIWECACGEGHLSERLKAKGYEVISTDLRDRGYGKHGVDFLKTDSVPVGVNTILTNPPYKYAKQFVEHAIDILPIGGKCYMFLKLTFLEGKSRKDMFGRIPPKRVLVSSSRIKCAMNGDFDSTGSSAVCYAWYEWEKGYDAQPVIEWIN